MLQEERDRQGDAARGSALPARLAHRDAAYRPVDNDDHHVDRNTPVGCRRSGSVVKMWQLSTTR